MQRYSHQMPLVCKQPLVFGHSNSECLLSWKFWGVSCTAVLYSSEYMMTWHVRKLPFAIFNFEECTCTDMFIYVQIIRQPPVLCTIIMKKNYCLIFGYKQYVVGNIIRAVQWLWWDTTPFPSWHHMHTNITTLCKYMPFCNNAISACLECVTFHLNKISACTWYATSSINHLTKPHTSQNKMYDTEYDNNIQSKKTRHQEDEKM
jgi:hypothetical protein